MALLKLRIKIYARSVYYSDRLIWLRRIGMMIALGPEYGYAIRTLRVDPRLWNARSVDVVVRKDAAERRFEADWLKRMAPIAEPSAKRSERKRRIREEMRKIEREKRAVDTTQANVEKPRNWN